MDVQLVKAEGWKALCCPRVGCACDCAQSGVNPACLQSVLESLAGPFLCVLTAGTVPLVRGACALIVACSQHHYFAAALRPALLMALLPCTLLSCSSTARRCMQCSALTLSLRRLPTGNLPATWPVICIGVLWVWDLLDLYGMGVDAWWWSAQWRVAFSDRGWMWCGQLCAGILLLYLQSRTDSVKCLAVS